MLRSCLDGVRELWSKASEIGPACLLFTGLVTSLLVVQFIGSPHREWTSTLLVTGIVGLAVKGVFSRARTKFVLDWYGDDIPHLYRDREAVMDDLLSQAMHNPDLMCMLENEWNRRKEKNETDESAPAKNLSDLSKIQR